MIWFWIIFGSGLLVLPFVAVKACLRIWPTISRLRLLMLSAGLLPGIFAALLIALTVAFVIEGNSMPPNSLDDAPQRGLLMLWALSPVVGFVAASCGLLFGWLAIRTHNVA
jgi:hypothetical protein